MVDHDLLYGPNISLEGTLHGGLNMALKGAFSL